MLLQFSGYLEYRETLLMNINSTTDHRLVELHSIKLKGKYKDNIGKFSLTLSQASSCHIRCENKQLTQTIYEVLAFKKHIDSGDYMLTNNVCRDIKRMKQNISILTVKQNLEFFAGLYQQTTMPNLTMRDMQVMLEFTDKEWRSKLVELAAPSIQKVSIIISLLMPYELYIFRHNDLLDYNHSDDLKQFMRDRLEKTCYIYISTKNIDSLFLPKPDSYLSLTLNNEGST